MGGEFGELSMDSGGDSSGVFYRCDTQGDWFYLQLFLLCSIFGADSFLISSATCTYRYIIYIYIYICVYIHKHI